MSDMERSFNTIVQMLSDRGYKSSSNTNSIELLKSEESILFTNKLETIQVRYYENFTKQVAEKITILAASSKEPKTHFLVFCKKLDSKANPFIKAIEGKVFVEVFTFDMLVFPIVRHVHVPPHRKLSNDEVDDLFEYYGIRKTYEVEEQEDEILVAKPTTRRRPLKKQAEEEVKKQVEPVKKEQVLSYDKQAILRKFPILLLSDPISRYYNYKPFDMVVINEHNEPYVKVVFDNLKNQ